MMKKLLMFLGIRQMLRARRRRAFMRRNAFLAPVGGVIPAIAWLAYHNRDRIIGTYKTRVAPRLQRGGTMKSAQPYQSAAI